MALKTLTQLKEIVELSMNVAMYVDSDANAKALRPLRRTSI